MNIDMLSNFRIGYFLDRVFEGEGHMPDSLSDIELGYYMGLTNIDLTAGNIKMLQFVLANWQHFVTEERNGIDHQLAKDLEAELDREINQCKPVEDKSGVVMRSWEFKL